jgi:hypothetical protein
MKTRLASFVLGITLVSANAYADTIAVVISPATLTGAPGGLLQFFGTLTNTTGANVFLNGAGVNLPGSAAGSVFLAPFFINAPLFLGPSGATGSFELFNVIIPNSFASGDHGGTFTVSGGIDGDAQNIIGTAQFIVRVQDAGPGVPEPSTWLLFGSSLLAVAAVRRGKPRESPNTASQGSSA